MDILKSDDLNFDYIEVGNVDEEGILIFVHQSLKDIIFSKAGNPVFAKTYGLLWKRNPWSKKAGISMKQ
jgi:hypothetical protein